MTFEQYCSVFVLVRIYLYHSIRYSRRRTLMTLAAAYIRFDSANYLTDQILTYHLRALLICAKNHHCQILRQFQDIGCPVSCRNRPGLNSMLEWMENERISLVFTPSANHILKDSPASQTTFSRYCFFCLKENLLFPLPASILSQ